MDDLKQLHQELSQARQAVADKWDQMPVFKGQFDKDARRYWLRENVIPLEQRLEELKSKFIEAVHNSEYEEMFAEYRYLTESSEW